jgi:hypothetical protein
MNTRDARWLVTLALSAAALVGCGDRSGARRVPEAKAAIATAPTVLRPEPVTTTPSPMVSCPTPATIAPAPLTAKAEPVKAARPVVKEDADLSVKRLVIAEGVSNREPVGAATSFKKADADRIYAFVELTNADEVDSEVTVTFVPPSGKAGVGNVTLEVGPHARWRTWAYTRGVKTAGTWTAVVRSMNGKVLAKQTFDVTE